MEDSLENLISYMEMEDDIFNQSSNSSIDEQEFLRDIILQQPDEGGDATSPTNSTLFFDETSFDQGNIDKGTTTTLHKSNSSNSIISSLERNTAFSPATCLVSFEADQPRGVHQVKKKVRRSSETQDHLMAERKRRRELTQSIIQLSAIIPGLKKMDKIYVLNEAVNYTKQLQKRVQELEDQNKDKRVNSAKFVLKSRASSNKSSTTYCERNKELLLEVEVRVKEKDVLIRIQCEKQKDIVLKTQVLLEKLHLSVTSSSILPFGTSILITNIFAKMDDRHSMTMDDLVENLRQYLLETYDIQ